MVFDWSRRAFRSAPPPPSAAKTVIGPFVPDFTPEALPPFPPEVTRVIEAARGQFIAFRGAFPPHTAGGLSFYGGLPMGPADMAWPHGGEGDNPLSFVIQWDCTALAPIDPTGLLPKDGVLYLFSNLGWGDNLVFRFIHMPGGTQGWARLPPPDNLPKLHQEREARLWGEDLPALYGLDQYPQRLLPHWPFDPVAVKYPALPEGSNAWDGPQYWNDSEDMTPLIEEALLQAQGAGPQPAALPNVYQFARPFAAFPHDWSAVRCVAAAALDALAYRGEDRWSHYLPQAEEAEGRAQVRAWRRLALALYELAAQNPPTTALSREHADAMWERIVPLAPVYGYAFQGAAKAAVNSSLALGSEGAELIPPEWLDDCSRSHRLAVVEMRQENAPQYRKRLNIDAKQMFDAHKRAEAAGELLMVRNIFAPSPHRMFGPPRSVQGDLDEIVDSYVLLLEMGSGPALGMPMGDGVLQFMIRPDDLRARRFDQVLGC